MTLSPAEFDKSLVKFADWQSLQKLEAFFLGISWALGMMALNRIGKITE
jgi:hypothetical protein